MLGKLYVRKRIEDYNRRMDELFGDCELRRVESFDGTPIAYRTVGKGLPIVLSPGVFTSYMFFHHFKNYFKDQYQVLLWDYRGHPESGVPEDISSVTLENHARDLVAVMDDAGVEAAVQVGFSMGVMTILELFRQARERVLGLIPINGPYCEGFGVVSKSRKVQDGISGIMDFLSGNPWLLGWARPVVLLPLNIPVARKVEINPTMDTSDEMKLYFEYIAKMNWKAGFRALASMGRFDGSDVLDEIDVPTLLITGTKDKWTPRRIADEMRERIKGAEFALVPGGSHATPAENPEMINYRVDLWLRTHFRE